jgi:hypothetical protein
MFIKRPENGLAASQSLTRQQTKKEYYYEKTSLDGVDGKRIDFRTRAAF